VIDISRYFLGTQITNDCCVCPLCRYVVSEDDFQSLTPFPYRATGATAVDSGEGSDCRAGHLDCPALTSSSGANVHPSRCHVDTVVGGDSCSQGMCGIMIEGKVYACSAGGEPSRRFFKIKWDAYVTGGVPFREFSLPLVRIRGMNVRGNIDSELVIPAHAPRTRRGGLARDEFVSRFVRAFCRDNPGIGVVLRHIGGGSEIVSEWTKHMMTDTPVFSRRYSTLDCLSAAVINAAFQVSGEEASSIVAGKIGGVQWKRSLKPIVRFFHESRDSGITLRTENVPGVQPAIEEDVEACAFEWFSADARSGVYILRLMIDKDGEHAVVVDTDRKLVIDSCKQYALRLSSAAVCACAGTGGGYRSVVQAMKICPR